MYCLQCQRRTCVRTQSGIVGIKITFFGACNSFQALPYEIHLLPIFFTVCWKLLFIFKVPFSKLSRDLISQLEEQCIFLPQFCIVSNARYQMKWS